jgi:hypothetical protein
VASCASCARKKTSNPRLPTGSLEKPNTESC